MTYRLYGTHLTAQVQDILEQTDDFLSVKDIVGQLLGAHHTKQGRGLEKRVRRAIRCLEIEVVMLKEIRQGKANIQVFFYKICKQ